MKLYNKILAIYGLFFLMLFLSAGVIYIIRNSNSPRGILNMVQVLTQNSHIFIPYLDGSELREREKFYEILNHTKIITIFETTKNEFKESKIVFDKVHNSKIHPERIYIVRFKKDFAPPLLIIISIVSVLILVLMLGTTYLMYSSVKSIASISKSIQEFGEGNWGKRHISVDNSYETKLLTESFNQMASKIESYRTRDKLLLRSVIHEIRNPVMALRWGWELFKKKKVDVNLEENIQSLEKALDEIQIITSAIVLEHKNELIKIKLLEFFDSFVKRMSPIVKNANRNIQFSSNKEFDPTILCNTNSLSIILKNLIQNFILYEPRENVIHFLLEESKGTIQIKLKISLPDSENWIFEPFQRGDNSNLSGDGIGLSISRIIAANMGWSLFLKDGYIVLSDVKL
ncbi:MAG TPA: HAMP domain-containing sensor histidine kinase [Leptospiraceae bacterium]|nr:HAMP domain-containing sensor histidine kinase [Leptospiraceae bacterium]